MIRIILDGASYTFRSGFGKLSLLNHTIYENISVLRGEVVSVTDLDKVAEKMDLGKINIGQKVGEGG